MPTARRGFFNDFRSMQSSVADLRALTRPGNAYFVNTFAGSNSNSGETWSSAKATLQAALDACATLDTIFIRGDIREECIGSNLKFDVTIVGAGSLHHPDQPSSAYDPGSSCWRPPASPTAATTLMEVRGRGWQFHNIMFDCPVDAAAIKLMTGVGSGLTEYDANHATIRGCDFRNGLYGIQDAGGCFNVTVEECVFETLDATSSAAGIRYLTTINAPRRWRILNNFFQSDSTTEGSERHIVSPLCGSLIQGNVFGTVKGTGKYIDLTGGQDNVVTQNVFGGAYDTSDYVAGTADLWLQNAVTVKAVTAPDGLTLAAPGA